MLPASILNFSEYFFDLLHFVISVIHYPHSFIHNTYY